MRDLEPDHHGAAAEFLTHRKLNNKYVLFNPLNLV
jgi:hypothetical protein